MKKFNSVTKLFVFSLLAISINVFAKDDAVVRVTESSVFPGLGCQTRIDVLKMEKDTKGNIKFLMQGVCTPSDMIRGTLSKDLVILINKAAIFKQITSEPKIATENCDEIAEKVCPLKKYLNGLNQSQEVISGYFKKDMEDRNSFYQMQELCQASFKKKCDGFDMIKKEVTSSLEMKKPSGSSRK